ncbi:hypothetical protein GOODEAATRI_004187 [Goodea atripinnis]|uniref:Uncharacterized protein n=1 Tax=Goodea atripinnis TaxID=208336 RepID=A0ABV0PV34_9TELE
MANVGCRLTKDMHAASRRIRTSRSSNCSRTSSHKDFPADKANGEKRFITEPYQEQPISDMCDYLPLLVTLWADMSTLLVMTNLLLWKWWETLEVSTDDVSQIPCPEPRVTDDVDDFYPLFRTLSARRSRYSNMYTTCLIHSSTSLSGRRGTKTVVPFRPHFSFCRFTSSRESPVLSLTQK